MDPLKFIHGPPGWEPLVYTTTHHFHMSRNLKLKNAKMSFMIKETIKMGISMTLRLTASGKQLGTQCKTMLQKRVTQVATPSSTSIQNTRVYSFLTLGNISHFATGVFSQDIILISNFGIRFHDRD